MVRKWSYIKNLKFIKILNNNITLRFRFKIFRESTRYKKSIFTKTRIKRRVYSLRIRRTSLKNTALLSTKWAIFYLKYKKILRSLQGYNSYPINLYIPNFNIFFTKDLIPFLKLKLIGINYISVRGIPITLRLSKWKLLNLNLESNNFLPKNQSFLQLLSLELLDNLNKINFNLAPVLNIIFLSKLFYNIKAKHYLKPLTVYGNILPLNFLLNIIFLILASVRLLTQSLTLLLN